MPASEKLVKELLTSPQRNVLICDCLLHDRTQEIELTNHDLWTNLQMDSQVTVLVRQLILA